jgi:hypothetical protein
VSDIKINKRDFENIKDLIKDSSVTYGRFSNKKIIEILRLNGSIKINRVSAQRSIIHLLKEENIFNFFRNNGYNISSINDIETYINKIIDVNPSRDVIQEWTSSTKAKKSKSLKGLYISSLKNLDIKINDETVTIIPINGLGYFCFHTEKIEIGKEIIIVGIENYQVIWFAKKYKEFFDRDNILFIVRNEYMREWISNLENEYIHFGDYDLAGINIYINEIIPRLKKSKKYSMFIPDNIEYLIHEHGNLEIYRDQKDKYKNLVAKDVKINKLYKIISNEKKGLEQEGLYKLV